MKVIFDMTANFDVTANSPWNRRPFGSPNEIGN
jgi:hypothetical protein